VYAQFGLPFETMPPASTKDLATLEGALGPIDAGLAALWRITQGSSDADPQPMFQRPGFLDALDLLAPWQARHQAKNMRNRAQRMWDLAGPASTDERLTGRWWEPGWLPFASFHGDIVLLVDAAPGPKGQAGQVIAFVHDPDQMQWIAPSFADYLQASADSIDADRQEFLLEPLDEQGLLDEDDEP
jgi:cell wall assembly regulator SMI1